MSSAGLPDRSGVRARRWTERGWGPIPQPVRRRPTRPGNRPARLSPCPVRAPRPAGRTARSRAGPRRPKASRAAQNAPKHGMRAQKYVLLPTTAVPGNANPKRAPSSRFFTLASDLSGLSCPREHAETDGPTVRSDVAELACLNRSRMSSRQHIWAVEAPIMGRTTASKGQENYLAQQPICTLLRNQTRNIDHSDVTTGVSAPNRGPTSIRLHPE